MNAYSWVSLVALVGWLALALSGYRAYRIGARKTLLLITVWVGLFLLVTGVFVAVGA